MNFNFELSQCTLLNQSTTSTIKNKNTDDNSQQQCRPKLPLSFRPEKLHSWSIPKSFVQSPNPHNNTVADADMQEKNKVAFCGMWEDYPHRQFRMEFRLEMGQLVGYSNAHHGEALTSVDGREIEMTIVHPKEKNRPLDHYRGRLFGLNDTCIEWEKQDCSRPNGWRPTRSWIKIE